MKGTCQTHIVLASRLISPESTSIFSIAGGSRPRCLASCSTLRRTSIPPRSVELVTPYFRFLSVSPRHVPRHVQKNADSTACRLSCRACLPVNACSDERLSELSRTESYAAVVYRCAFLSERSCPTKHSFVTQRPRFILNRSGWCHSLASGC